MISPCTSFGFFPVICVIQARLCLLQKLSNKLNQCKKLLILHIYCDHTICKTSPAFGTSNPASATRLFIFRFSLPISARTALMKSAFLMLWTLLITQTGYLQISEVLRLRPFEPCTGQGLFDQADAQ